MVLLIPQERGQQRTVEWAQVVEETGIQIIPQERIIDRIVDVPVAMQCQVPTIQTVPQTADNLQVHFFDRVVDVPVVMQLERSLELCTVTTNLEEIHFWIVRFSAAYQV